MSWVSINEWHYYTISFFYDSYNSLTRLFKHTTSPKQSVAEAIRNGKMDPNEVPKVVTEANKDHLFSELAKALPKELRNAKITRLDSVQLMTGGEQILCDLSRMTCGSNTDLAIAFANDFFGKNWGNVKGILDKIIQEQAANITVQDWALLSTVHESYNRACDKWKTVIEQETKKSFTIETCRAYNVSFADFVAVCCGLVDRSKNYTIKKFCQEYASGRAAEKGQDKNVLASARGVKEGWDTIRLQCWECGQVAAKVSKCSLCMAARYCSVACQRKSWKSGHRSACSALKTMYQGFTENYGRIDKALRLQKEKCPTPMCAGCTLAPAGAKDYYMLPLMLVKEVFPIQPDISGEKTIDQMYKSLGDIVSGSNHWMFPDTFSGTLEAYLGSTVIERAVEWEMTYMRHGLLFLAGDLSKVLPRNSLPLWIHTVKDHLRQISKTGELMPAARFIGIYYRFGLAGREGYENPSARLEQMARCLTFMIKCFHKTTLLDTDTLNKTIASLDGQE